MEMRDLAIQILSATTIEGKLAFPNVLTDDTPGKPIFWETPSRPVNMGFQKATKNDRLPRLHELKNQDNRAVCLHRFCGHELLAVEIMAHALLAFPDAPPHFRRGLANTLREEQVHVEIYMERLAKMGVRFGDMPLFEHFWAHVKHVDSIKKYISMMALTFEMANLDFAPMYGNVFATVGDTDSANLMKQILKDEISHVSFGYHWLKKWKDTKISEWEHWKASLPVSLSPGYAKGRHFQRENRKAAGIPEEWIDQLIKT